MLLTSLCLKTLVTSTPHAEAFLARIGFSCRYPTQIQRYKIHPLCSMLVLSRGNSNKLTIAFSHVAAEVDECDIVPGVRTTTR